MATVCFVSQRPARFDFSCCFHAAEGHVRLGLAHAQAVCHWRSESRSQGAPINGFKPVLRPSSSMPLPGLGGQRALPFPPPHLASHPANYPVLPDKCKDVLSSPKPHVQRLCLTMVGFLGVTAQWWLGRRTETTSKSLRKHTHSHIK